MRFWGWGKDCRIREISISVFSTLFCLTVPELLLHPIPDRCLSHGCCGDLSLLSSPVSSLVCDIIYYQVIKVGRGYLWPGSEMETKSSGFWSGNLIPSRRKDERRLLGLHDKGGYASLSSLGEVQALSETSEKQAGSVHERLRIPLCIYGQNSTVAPSCVGWVGGGACLCRKVSPQVEKGACARSCAF